MGNVSQNATFDALFDQMVKWRKRAECAEEIADQAQAECRKLREHLAQMTKHRDEWRSHAKNLAVRESPPTELMWLGRPMADKLDWEEEE